MNYSFMETNNSITMDKALCRLLDVPFPTDGDLNEKSIEDTLLEAVSGLKKSLLAKDQSFAQEHMRRTAAGKF